MLVNLNLNTKDINIDCDGDETLLIVLRKFNMVSVKNGRSDGLCGCSTVLLNDKAVPSSLIPIGSLHNQAVITLEHFSTTKEYDDIAQALQSANISLCGFCNAGKIFAIDKMISGDVTPTRSDIFRQMSSFTCTCTNIEKLFNVVLKAFDIRYERLWKDTYAKK